MNVTKFRPTKLIKSPLDFLKLISFISILILHLLNLNADLGIFKRVGDIGDGALWSHEAKNLIYYGSPIVDEYAQSLSVGIGNFVWTYIFFLIFKVSISTLALSTIVWTFVFIFISAIVFIRRKITGYFVLNILFLSSFNIFLIERTGMPLAAMGVISSLVLLYVVISEKDCSHLFLGSLLAVGLSFSLSFLLFLPVVIVIVFIKNKFYTLDLVKNIKVIFLTLIPSIFYLIIWRTIYINYISYLEPTYLAVTQSRSPLSNPVSFIYENLEYLASRNIFLLTDILSKEVFNAAFSLGNFFAIVLVYIFLQLVFFSKFFQNNFDSKNENTKISLKIVFYCWLGYFLILLLFSDLGYHRFQIFGYLIPVTLWIIWKSDFFPINFKQLKVESLPIFFFISFFVNIFILIYLYKSIEERILFLLFVLILIFFMRNHFIYYNTKKQLLFLYLLSTLAISYKLILFQTSVLQKHTVYNLSNLSLPISIITILLLLLTIFFNRNFLIFSFLLTNLILILFYHNTATYSVYTESERLSKLIPENSIVLGPEAALLSLEGKWKGHLWIPNAQYGSTDLEFWNSPAKLGIKPTHLLYARKVNWSPPEPYWDGTNLDSFWPTARNVVETLPVKRIEKLEDIKLYPYGDEFQLELELYRLEY